MSRHLSSGSESVELGPGIVLGWSWMYLTFQSIFSLCWEERGPDIYVTSSSHGYWQPISYSWLFSLCSRFWCYLPPPSVPQQTLSDSVLNRSCPLYSLSKKSFKQINAFFWGDSINFVSFKIIGCPIIGSAQGQVRQALINLIYWQMSLKMAWALN